MTKQISCNFNCKFNSRTCDSNQKRDNRLCKCECKNSRKCRKRYSWNPSACICENDKYLKSIADTSVIAYDEIISIINIVSTKMTNAIATNVSINYHNKKVRWKIDCYIFYSVLLAIMLPLITAIICYHYAKHRSKQEGNSTSVI